MRIEQLEQLVQINQWGSMNIAAQYLHMTHQNLSRSMKQLEEELGITIFLRTKKGTLLTENGEKLLSFALTVLNEQKKLFTAFETSRKSSVYDNSTHSYKLNVALTASMENIFTPLLYNLIQLNFPITTNTFERSIDDCINALTTDFEQDIVILQHDYKYLLEHSKAAANYHLYALYSEKLELLTCKTNPLSQSRSVSRNLFETIPLVVFSQDGTPSNSAQICMDNNIDINIVSYTNVPSVLQEHLISGTHCGIGVPSVQRSLYTNPTTRDMIIAVPIDIPLRIVTAFFIKKDLCETPLGEAILTILNNVYKTLEQLY